MMVKISLNTVTRECIADSTFLGFEGENQANVLDFSFSDKFIDGTAVLNIKRGKDTGFVSVDKVGSGYQLPVKSSLLSQVGDVTFQFVITTVEGSIMKFDPFVMTVEDAIDTDVPLPEEYPSWVEMANTKLAEIDVAIEQANKISSQILVDKANGVFDGKDGEDGISPTAKVTQIEEGAEVTITDASGTTKTVVKHGIDGEDGVSSEILVKTSTATEYVLTVKDKNGSFDTPNLKGQDGGIETDPIYLADKPNLALKSEIPTKLSELNNDKGFITEYTETDPLYSTDKPKLALKTELPTKLSQLQNDSKFISSYTETDPTVPTYVKAITENDINKWNNKQDTLTAGNNITIENGVISASGSGEGGLAELPIATSDTLGGIKVGEGLEITEDGILSALGGSGASQTVLFEGEINANGNITLQENIEEFDYILVGNGYYSSEKKRVKPLSCISVKEIISNGYNANDLYMLDSGAVDPTGTNFTTVWFSCVANNQLQFTLNQNGGLVPYVDVIYGIKLGSSGGSSYKEQELLSEPLEYTATSTDGWTMIQTDVDFVDSIDKYNRIEFWIELKYEVTGRIYHAQTHSILVSNIVYHDSDTNSSSDGSHFNIPFGMPFQQCAINGWFKTPNKLFFNSIGVHFTNTSNQVALTGVYIRSIKGIKY